MQQYVMIKDRMDSTTVRNKLTLFQNTLLEWFVSYKRELVWRDFKPDPYVVLVSETMLQQTQASRVNEKLPIFLERFPTVYELAKASNAEIIVAWQGMGYNNRALRLRDAAKKIVAEYDGIIPADRELLISLPGIGRYTASAIVSFAYKIDVPIVDVNIRRVLTRIFYSPQLTTDLIGEGEIWKRAEEIIPIGKGAMWHQALMDLGSAYCTARVPDCGNCIVKDYCNSALRLREGKKTKKAEPSFRGIPNRIWRGKIVQILRQSEGHTLNKDFIIEQLFSSFSNTEETDWFSLLVDKLIKEGIITIPAHNPQNLSLSY